MPMQNMDMMDNCRKEILADCMTEIQSILADRLIWVHNCRIVAY